MNTKDRMDLLWSLLAGAGLGALLACLDRQGNWWQGWLAFSLIASLGLTLLVKIWRKAGSVRWLGGLVLLAFGLRLGLGVSLSFILPVSGYDSEVQNAGYNSVDAYNRDLQSWQLAISDRPILDAFDKEYAVDQYGGLQALSTLVYRYLSPDAHRPWLVILMAAAFSALGVVFLWQAARLAWDEKIAALSAWIFALYPESLWLGSSQMREPFLLTFLALVLWGLVVWLERRERTGWMWLALGLAGLLLFSPGVALYGIVALAGWVWLRKKHPGISWRGVGLVGGLLVIGLLLLWVSLSRGTLQGASLLDTLTGWFKLSIKWDIYQLERDSGAIQHLFRNVLPEQLKIPFIFGYGLLQPVLPAALFDSSNPLWQIIGIVRSLGWYLLLPLLVYSLFPILKALKEQQKTAWLWLFAITWLWIAISSLRAGGDQWDNPRYRTILLLFQALLAAKAWLYYRETRHTYLSRIIMIEAVFLLVFMEWYAARYYPLLPRLSFKVMIGLIGLSSAGILSVGYYLDKRRNRRFNGK